MIAIQVMAKFGPWMFLRVEDKGWNKGAWEYCERQGCDEHIRYVHVCQIDGETKEWRIGSTCGPKLMDVSDAIWDKAAKAVARDLRLVHRALRLKELEAGPTPYGGRGVLPPDWLDPIIACLMAGETNNYNLCSTPGVGNLRYIQHRLGRAEKHHELGRIRIGGGK